MSELKKKAKFIQGGLGKLILRQREADKLAASLRAKVKAAKLAEAKAKSRNPKRTAARSAIKSKQ